MDRALGRFRDPRRRVIARVFASAAASLACVAAAESTAVFTTKLLIDGAAVAATWSVARLAVWTARALRRAVRAAVAS